MQKHPIFEYFAGVPLVISIVAPLSVYKSLSEIFLYMAEKNDSSDESFQQEEGLKRFDDNSLINCLEYSTNYLSKMKTNIL